MFNGGCKLANDKNDKILYGRLLLFDVIKSIFIFSPFSSGGCLDFERTKAYFLSYSATDEEGRGRRSVASLRVTVADANDNAPR